MTTPISARALAAQLGVEFVGSGDVLIERVAAVEDADSGCLTLFASRKYLTALRRTDAGAVILDSEYVGDAPCPCLVSPNPYLTFARALEIIHPRVRPAPGCHPSAVIDADAQIDPSAAVGPLCVIEAGVVIGSAAEIGPGCILQRDSRIGAGSRLVAAVTVCAGSLVGERVLLHPGAVIGRDGFGFARDGERWVRIPQIGRVRIGNDVEIGTNTAVDRGAIGETVIANGVKLDNLIQIGHNVQIGENTAMAACSGISGSTQIGRNCSVAGAVGMAGHLRIADGVHFTGMAMVTRSVASPGVYSSGIPAMANADWRRNVARFRHLDDLTRRVQRLEATLARVARGDDEGEE
ncbi:MAG: UDP-3-O-(3-hydroxymyristoyl)glucosamine N-acyltransferase [Chromatiaceae bacterium]|nr:MAG: UDP-3-O-(3-hydroxymyristoyl)glucosamine N-acyltransferase [Chromatiaceae bacterium]